MENTSEKIVTSLIRYPWEKYSDYENHAYLFGGTDDKNTENSNSLRKVEFHSLAETLSNNTHQHAVLIFWPIEILNLLDQNNSISRVDIANYSHELSNYIIIKKKYAERVKLVNAIHLLEQFTDAILPEYIPRLKIDLKKIDWLSVFLVQKVASENTLYSDLLKEISAMETETNSSRWTKENFQKKLTESVDDYLRSSISVQSDKIAIEKLLYQVQSRFEMLHYENKEKLEIAQAQDIATREKYESQIYKIKKTSRKKELEFQRKSNYYLKENMLNCLQKNIYLNELEKSHSSIIFRIINKFKKSISKSTEFEKQSKHANELERSEYFDSEWYLQKYQDVALANDTAAMHYLLHGYKEGRNPSPKFDGNVYLTKNPDVLKKGMNPLLHYILHGQSEGRKIYRIAKSNKLEVKS